MDSCEKEEQCKQAAILRAVTDNERVNAKLLRKKILNETLKINGCIQL